MASQATLALKARNGGIRPAQAPAGRVWYVPSFAQYRERTGWSTRSRWHREDTMVKYIEVASVTGSGARFESPLALWIAIWQRQLVSDRG